MTDIKKRGGKRAGAGRPLLAESDKKQTSMIRIPDSIKHVVVQLKRIAKAEIITKNDFIDFAVTLQYSEPDKLIQLFKNDKQASTTTPDSELNSRIAELEIQLSIERMGVGVKYSFNDGVSPTQVYIKQDGRLFYKWLHTYQRDFKPLNAKVVKQDGRLMIEIKKGCFELIPVL